MVSDETTPLLVFLLIFLFFCIYLRTFAATFRTFAPFLGSTNFHNTVCAPRFLVFHIWSTWTAQFFLCTALLARPTIFLRSASCDTIACCTELSVWEGRVLGWMTYVGWAECKQKVKDVAWVGSFAVV